MKKSKIPDFTTEIGLYKLGYSLIAGIDEAGRGSLAGPIVAAAVIFKKGEIPDIPRGYIKDSKKIAEKKRLKSAEYIKNIAAYIGIGVVSNTFIDNKGISNANRLVFLRALENLNIEPDHLLIDGNLKFEHSAPSNLLVRGDTYCYSIAAASILAKVSRDSIMHKLSTEYPQYRFSKHKGYGTEEHRNLIRKFGPTKHHRKSFLKNVI